MATTYGVDDPLKGCLVTDGLIFYIHPSLKKCYNGGATVTDLVGGKTISMTGSSMGVTKRGNFRFNGSNDKMEVNSTLIDGDGDHFLSSSDSHYTLEAWINTDTSSGTTTSAHCILGNNSARGVGMQVGKRNGKPRLNFAARGTSNFYSNDLEYSNWYHIVFAHQHGSFTNVYINGSLHTTANANRYNIRSGNQGNMFIGQAQGRVRQYFSGFMGPIRIYNRGLSADEALQNFNASKVRYGL